MKPLHIGDIADSWYDDYVSSLGVWVEPDHTAAHPWRRLKDAWRKRKQRQSDRWLRWHDAVNQFNVACQKLDLEPEAALRVLTADMLINEGDIVRREIAASKRQEGKQ
jgi:hypothetical protein